MDRPHISRGIGCSFGACGCVLVFATMLSFGCVAQTSTHNPDKPKTSTKKPAGTTLASLAFDSFQKRDRLRAEKLRRIADDVSAGRLKYDGPIMEAIEKAGAESSRETWQPVADQLARLLGDEEKLDSVKCEKVLRELAQGAEKAGM